MVIAWDKENFMPMFPLDQMLMITECREIYKQFGIHSLYYCILFGWDGSPYKNQFSEKERHTVISEDIFSKKLFDITKKKDIDPPSTFKLNGFFYENTFFIKAIKALNRYAPVPALKNLQFIQKQLEHTREQADTKFSGDGDKVKEQLAKQKLFLENIDKLEKMEKVAIEEINKIFKVERLASLDDLMLNVM